MYQLSFLIFLLLARLAEAAPADDLVVQGNEALNKMDVAAAMAAYSTALDADPKHAQAAYQRGRIFLKIGEPQKAIADFTTTILAMPTDGRAYARRGEAKVVLKALEQAFADFDKAVEVSPRDYEVFVVRATYKWKRGDLRGAVADMQSAMAVADPATAAQLLQMMDRMK
jgi:tetratricopeptide (TPR) repeat protein